MNYAIYKNSRNASWQCLIDCCVTELPVRPVQIAKHYGIMCTYSDSLSCDGVISRTKDNVSIVIRKEQPRTRQRYTILHELGHYLLGHLDKEYQSEAEYAADRQPQRRGFRVFVIEEKKKKGEKYKIFILFVIKRSKLLRFGRKYDIIYSVWSGRVRAFNDTEKKF